ncbi:HAD family phosphatase [uncultured Tateyamaria sp.]|uniref:HAD family hydrolase n=1 Tax=uncultured Tateyamaria sp. TaxID=455651 RepID=UPI00262DDA80|nr:HAD family phosphatase [uncultured Tateyamaria sp.]
MNDTPAAYLFDMDGLLLDSERVYRQVLIDLLVPQGHALAEIEDLFLRLVGNSGTRSRAILGTVLDGDVTDFDTQWHKGVREALTKRIRLRPTVEKTLSTLAQTGARMAVVTSTHGAAARQHLANARLLHHFEHVVAGDEVPANKPDPAPYLQAANALRLDPSHCAAFEDSDAGITSAMMAGCRGVQIPDLRPNTVPLPDLGQHVAPDLWTGVETVQGRGPKARTA